MYELLLADGDREVLSQLAVTLQRPGVRLNLARSYEEALGAATAAPLDAAVVAARLGSPEREDGLGLLQRLQASRPAVPVIVITGSSDSGLLGKAYRLGARSFLRKPLDFDEIEEQLGLLGLPSPDPDRRLDSGRIGYRTARFAGSGLHCARFAGGLG
jgi:DNA-binding NtrC family response regulator